jgi:hypothetical protein
VVDLLKEQFNPAPAPRPPGRTVEERLLDHYLGNTDWRQVPLETKRLLIEVCLPVEVSQ